tara:strand:+ start:1020 stop:2129 length:1110 start_codon:yes stop_codon:yes gene_type:complete
MLHPGKNYHLFDRFIETNSVSADIPNISFPNRKAPNSIPTIDSQISRARALRDWLSLNSSERKRTDYSVALSDYENVEPRRFHESYKATLQRLLWELPENTPVFVPNPGLNNDGIFCELCSSTQDRVEFSGLSPADNFTYLGRPVRNVRKVPMRLIPPEVLDQKSRTSVITDLTFSQSEKMLRLYYGTFSILGKVNQTEIDIPSEIFRPADANIVNAIANFLEENLQRLERGETTPADFIESIFFAFDEAELQIHARLNSPGILQIAAKTVAPALIAFFMAMPNTMSAQEMASEIASKNIEIVNSSCPNDDDYPKLIGDRLFGIVDMVGEDNISDICMRVKEFKKRTGATVNSKIEYKNTSSSVDLDGK